MKKDELIAHYFTHKLSPEAQKEFDHLMATDPEFAKDVVFQENIKVAIKKEEQEQLKEELKSFESTLENPRKNYVKWFVAASIIALLALPSIWYFGNSTIDTNTLFADNFSPYRNVVHPIVRGETSNDIKTKAFTAYETKNYNEALNYFNQIIKNNSDKTILFYKANVLLQLGKTDEAITILQQTLKTSDSLTNKSHWYLALAYIKNNNLDKAKQSLKTLSNSTFKTDAVNTLLKQLD